ATAPPQAVPFGIFPFGNPTTKPEPLLALITLLRPNGRTGLRHLEETNNEKYDSLNQVSLQAEFSKPCGVKTEEVVKCIVLGKVLAVKRYENPKPHDLYDIAFEESMWRLMALLQSMIAPATGTKQKAISAQYSDYLKQNLSVFEKVATFELEQQVDHSASSRVVEERMKRAKENLIILRKRDGHDKQWSWSCMALFYDFISMFKSWAGSRDVAYLTYTKGEAKEVMTLIKSISPPKGLQPFVEKSLQEAEDWLEALERK
ncbi:hypothetical protein H0H93_016297, partial [Arthromyces matolae]